MGAFFVWRRSNKGTDIAGHEPCGIIVEEGEGLKRFKKGIVID